MKKAGKPNSLLIELVIVLLFFSLSASVILQLFVATHNKSTHSKVGSAALMLAEDLNDRFAVSDLAIETFLAASGWVPAEDGDANAYVRTVNLEGRALEVAVTGAQQTSEAGVLDEYAIDVYDRGDVIIHLPMVRYSPREVTP